MKRSAFTLAELVLGMALMAMIGLAVAGASSVLTRSYTDDEQAYKSLHAARISLLKVGAEIHHARLVLHADGYYFMIWNEDTGGDDKINISELVLVRHDAASSRLLRHQVTYPSSLHPMLVALLDQQVSLNTLVVSPAYSMSSLLNTLYCQTTVLAEDVDSFDVWLNGQAPLGETVVVSIRISEGKTGCTLRNAYSVRNSTADKVGIANGQWHLMGN